MVRINLSLVYAMIFIAIAFSSFASAEITFWNGVTLNDTTKTVSLYGTYIFQDTQEQVDLLGVANSFGGFGAMALPYYLDSISKDTNVNINYLVQALPFNFSDGTSVDYCNLTLVHYKTNYNSDGSINNTNAVTQSMFFGTGGVQSGILTVPMRLSDFLSVKMKCHYPTGILLDENVYVGTFQTYMGSFECSQCSQYSLEELTHQTAVNEEIASSSSSIYDYVNTFVEWNYKFWLILIWIVKIALILVGITLIFASVYYVYKFFKDLSNF